jgi:adenosylcobinamide kinase/adenosylcobinamide-phosphate guanylyltransferase
VSTTPSGPPARRPPLVLVTGGARSGKSRFALARASVLGLPRLFVATAEALDGEMAARIARHRAERGGEWRTIEAPLRLADVARREEGQAIVVDCLTLWLANVMGDGAEAKVEESVSDLVAAFAERRSAIVAVTNEVGAGIVPENPLARAFRDAAGSMNQRVAAIADEVHLLVAGQPLRVR